MSTKTPLSTLSSENEAFIRQMLERGVYQNQDAIVNAAVDLLRQRTELLDPIKEGRRQLDEGEYKEFDDAGLDELFLELTERARKQSQQTPAMP